jgi:hypothetical protein
VEIRAHPIQAIMFHANDEKKHDVAYGHVSGEYLFENEDGLICSSPNLQNLLGLMWLATGCSSDNWTISDNPYGE